MVRYLFYTIGDLTYQSPLVVSLVEYNIFLTSCADWLHFPPSHCTRISHWTFKCCVGNS